MGKTIGWRLAWKDKSAVIQQTGSWAGDWPGAEPPPESAQKPHGHHPHMTTHLSHASHKLWGSPGHSHS